MVITDRYQHKYCVKDYEMKKKTEKKKKIYFLLSSEIIKMESILHI